MSKLEYMVYIKPVAKGRPRITTWGGFARAYTPKKTKDFEEALRYEIKRLEPLLECPLTCELSFYESIPKAFNKKKIQAALLDEIRPQARPDLDNYIKAVLDALNEHIYKDDKQIYKITAERFYANEPAIKIVFNYD